MFFNLLRLSSLVSLPRPPPLHRLSFPFFFYGRPRFTPASSFVYVLFIFSHFPIYSSLLVLLPTSPSSRLFLHDLLLLFLSPHPGSVCGLRVGRGGPGRRPAALLRQGVLVVPTHVEPHAAPPLPQPVGAGGADAAQQEVCPGRGHAHAHILKDDCRSSLLFSCSLFQIFKIHPHATQWTLISRSLRIVGPIERRLSQNPLKDGQL